jgi:Tol biopolymer transport system component
MGKRGRPPHPDILNRREHEVLALLRDGLSKREIPATLVALLGLTGFALLALTACNNAQSGSTSTTEETPFISETDVWVVNADGSDLKRLTELRKPILAGYNIAPAWSPDGTRIAFFAGSGANYAETGHLYVMNADGTEVTQLAPASFDYTRSSWCESDRSPVWSPNGEFLAYQAENRVHVVNPDTGESFGSFPRNSFDPSWSPDSKMVAYSIGTFDCVLAAYSLEGDSALSLAGVRGQDATWSPDGSRLAYVDDGRIIVADADGRNGVKVAQVDQGQDELEPWNLHWSPDGTSLSYMFYGSDTYSTFVYIVDLTSQGNQTRLGAPDHRIYAWSPDGRSIVYQVQEDDDCHYPDAIYVRNADGRNVPRKVVRGESPSWSPDGSKIAFVQTTLSPECPTPQVED